VTTASFAFELGRTRADVCLCRDEREWWCADVPHVAPHKQPVWARRVCSPVVIGRLIYTFAEGIRGWVAMGGERVSAAGRSMLPRHVGAGRVRR
jgi:hypothetical protein